MIFVAKFYFGPYDGRTETFPKRLFVMRVYHASIKFGKTPFETSFPVVVHLYELIGDSYFYIGAEDDPPRY